MAQVLSESGDLLRTGYTTGACATAAAKHALKECLSTLPHFDTTSIEILSPDGALLKGIDAILLEKTEYYAKAKVIKDAGDDYDVTDGIEIFAEVTLIPASDLFVIEGGEGVGRVTKPGLQIPVGAYAINPKPLQMLESNLKPLLPNGMGLRVIISAPKGVLLAEKTFNPRLGIVGGISIIGTTGIVRPMSEDAFKRSIYVELQQKRALGNTSLILVPGKHGENFAVNQLGLEHATIVHMSNFVGFTLSAAEKLGFTDIKVIGHIGKLIKVAGGIFNTHSKVADARNEIVVAHLALLKAPFELIEKIYTANTTDEISDILFETTYASVFENIAKVAKTKMIGHLMNLKQIEVVYYDMKLRKLADTRSHEGDQQ